MATLGDIGIPQQRYDVLPMPALDLGDVERWTAAPSATVPAPEPMPAPTPQPTPEPVPGGGNPSPAPDPGPTPTPEPTRPAVGVAPRVLVHNHTALR